MGSVSPVSPSQEEASPIAAANLQISLRMKVLLLSPIFAMVAIGLVYGDSDPCKGLADLWRFEETEGCPRANPEDLMAKYDYDDKRVTQFTLSRTHKMLAHYIFIM